MLERHPAEHTCVFSPGFFFPFFFFFYCCCWVGLILSVSVFCCCCFVLFLEFELILQPRLAWRSSVFCFSLLRSRGYRYSVPATLHLASSLDLSLVAPGLEIEGRLLVPFKHLCGVDRRASATGSLR